MNDASTPSDGVLAAQACAATDVRGWLHTAQLGLVFVVLAMLADVAGLARDGTPALVRQRSPSATTKPLPGAALIRGRIVAAVERPTAAR